ncbi:MAG: MEKHLA domain-containing protein [Methylococcales bacterium]
MITFAEPSSDNFFLEHPIDILRTSLRHWSGQDLVESEMGSREAAEYLYNAPFALLSHDTGADPMFNYANRIAQKLFGMNWSEIIGMHSRCSTEPENQEGWDRLLQAVSNRGYVDHYQGVRISRNGRRFLVSNTIVRNPIGPDGKFYGQAEYLDEKNT